MTEGTPETETATETETMTATARDGRTIGGGMIVSGVAVVAEVVLLLDGPEATITTGLEISKTTGAATRGDQATRLDAHLLLLEEVRIYAASCSLALISQMARCRSSFSFPSG